MAYSVPNTFVNGTIGDAGQVNANFTALLNAVNNSIAADNSIGPAANIGWNNFNLTGVGVFGAVSAAVSGSLSAGATSVSTLAATGAISGASAALTGAVTAASATISGNINFDSTANRAINWPLPNIAMYANASSLGIVDNANAGRVPFYYDQTANAINIGSPLKANTGLTVTGAASVSTNLSVTGNTLTGTLNVSGVTGLAGTSITGNLGVSGTATLGAASVTGNLGVTGTATLGALGVTGATTGTTGAFSGAFSAASGAFTGALSAASLTLSGTALGVAYGGTGGTTAAGARANLGVDAAATNGSNANGNWVKMANGYIRQWGQAILPNSGAQSATIGITFPTAFAAGPIAVFGNALGGPTSSWNNLSVTVPATTLTTATLQGDSGSAAVNFNRSIGVFWSAEGF